MLTATGEQLNVPCGFMLLCTPLHLVLLLRQTPSAESHKPNTGAANAPSTAPYVATDSEPPTAPKLVSIEFLNVPENIAIKRPTASEEAVIEVLTASRKTGARAPRNALNEPTRVSSSVRSTFENEYAVATLPYVRGISARSRANSHISTPRNRNSCACSLLITIICMVMVVTVAFAITVAIPFLYLSHLLFGFSL